MKKNYVNGMADSGAATAGQESKLEAKPRTIYEWVRERYTPTIKLGTVIRSDQASIATWVKKRKNVGRISKRLVVALRSVGGAQ
jgi:hypothetical protein